MGDKASHFRIKPDVAFNILDKLSVPDIKKLCYFYAFLNVKNTCFFKVEMTVIQSAVC